MERLLDELAERLPGAEDRLIRHVHDRRRRRAAADRRTARDQYYTRYRRPNRDADSDQGTNTHAAPMPRIPPVNDRHHGAHDARPWGHDDFLERFPETRRIVIQG